MQGVQVSHPPQCRAVDGQIDGYPVHLHTRDRPYTRRRDVTQISSRERWRCPNKGCGKQYKRTSSIGIARHKRFCHNRLTVTGWSIFHYDHPRNTLRDSGLKPIAARVLLQQIKTPIYKSDTVINLNTGGYGIDPETRRDSSQGVIDGQKVQPELFDGQKVQPELFDGQRGQFNFNFPNLGVSAPVLYECGNNLDSQSSYRLNTTYNSDSRSKVALMARTFYTDPPSPKLQAETPSSSSFFLLESLPEAALSEACHDLLIIRPMPPPRSPALVTSTNAVLRSSISVKSPSIIIERSVVKI